MADNDGDRPDFAGMTGRKSRSGQEAAVRTRDELVREIRGMDGRGYPALKALAGAWRMDGVTLFIDHVQGDPFASPSSLHVFVDGKTAGFPKELYETPERKLALEDQLARRSAAKAAGASRRLGSGRSGEIVCSRPGPEILRRSAVCVDPASGSVTFRFQAGLPAEGRRIDGKKLEELLAGTVPALAAESLWYRNLDSAALFRAAYLADDVSFLRKFIRERNLIAFVADGAVLPRKSGSSSAPRKDAVPFQSPASLRVEVDLPRRGRITGMGIPRGVVLITGGGFHGKSTLLDALAMGVYDHAAGDGRELVVTDDTAVRIRAEDGRSIFRDDISLFLKDLPDGSDSALFSTKNASGSTSEAAGIAEAMEGGARVLLFDEDTSAANLLMRDALMEQLVPKEPIIPLVDRIRGLYEKLGVSTVLAAGSFGSYFAVADTVIRMENYRAQDITKEAARAAAGMRRAPLPFSGGPKASRCPEKNTALLDPRTKVRINGTDGFCLGREEVDLRLLSQLADSEQTKTAAFALLFLERHVFDGRTETSDAVDTLFTDLEKRGFEAILEPSRAIPFLALPRKMEILSAVNRYRGLR